MRTTLVLLFITGLVLAFAIGMEVARICLFRETERHTPAPLLQVHGTDYLLN